MHMDRSHIWKEKVADSKIFGYLWMGPECPAHQGFPLFLFKHINHCLPQKHQPFKIWETGRYGLMFDFSYFSMLLKWLKWYYDQKIISFFLTILKVYSLNIQLAKFWALRFIRRLFILSVSFGFDGLPWLTFKTDR